MTLSIMVYRIQNYVGPCKMCGNLGKYPLIVDLGRLIKLLFIFFQVVKTPPTNSLITTTIIHTVTTNTTNSRTNCQSRSPWWT